MSVLEVLSREHKIFRGLLKRMGEALKYDEQTARSEVGQVLLVLLPALDGHEELEDLVFVHPAYVSARGARELLAENAVEHRKIETLRAELQAALEGADGFSFERLKELVRRLVEQASLHFDHEERRLWPHYRRRHRESGRSPELSLERRALERVKSLEKKVAQTAAMVSDYARTRP